MDKNTPRRQCRRGVRCLGSASRDDFVPQFDDLADDLVDAHHGGIDDDCSPGGGEWGTLALLVSLIPFDDGGADSEE